MLLLLACHAPAPAPWADLAPLAPEAMRPVLRAELDDAANPTRMVTSYAQTFVLDQGRVHVLDSRYRHDPRPHCLPLDRWPELSDDGRRQGACDPGEIQVARGEIGQDIVAMAPALGGLDLLDAAGVLYHVNLDPLGGDPLDLGRPRELGTTGIAGALGLAVGADALWIWTSTTLHQLGPELAPDVATPLPARPLDGVIYDGAPWILTQSGLAAFGLGLVLGGPVGDDARLAVAADGVWVSDPAGLLARYAADGTVVHTFLEHDRTGPIAAGPDRVYVATVDGVVRMDASGATEPVGGPGARDLVYAEPGELRVLDADGVTARFDDDLLADGPPLRVFIASAVENPKSDESEAPCLGADPESIATQMDVLERNLSFLDDLPIPVAVSLTPSAARRAAACGKGRALADALAAPEIDVGLFLHGLPDGCDDAASANGCDTNAYLAFLSGELSALTGLGLQPTYATGMAEHTRVGLDWTQVFPALDLPPRFPFFAESLWPEVPKDDPRKKDPFTRFGLTPATAWRVGDAFGAVAEDDPSGTVTMLPGDNIPGYFLGDCANLTVDECNVLDAGGRATFDAEDVAVLDLLVERALGQRGDGTVATWSFHLPALERFDDTEGCTVEGRRWSGETCEAARLQEWAFALHARFALDGTILWNHVALIPTLPTDP